MTIKEIRTVSVMALFQSNKDRGFMNSGQSSTELNDMLTQFTEYVYSFYGAPDALYPMGVTKADILGATYDYLHAITTLNHERFTWGDGDSLDRERVRDFLVRNYGYSKDFDGGSLWVLDQEEN